MRTRAIPCLSVIIAVYNERDRIPTLLRRLHATPPDKQLILVDDRSTDGTRELLQTLETELHEENHRHTVLFHERRRGKGACIRSAIPHCCGEVTLIQDADLEYCPDDYPRLVELILEGRADVVYGSRFRGSITAMHWSNRLGNRVLTWLANRLYNADITDEATCYKAFRTDLLKSLPLTCERFEFCPEVTALVRKRGIRIHEVPISYKGRTRAEGKKIRAYDFFEAVWTLVKYRFINPDRVRRKLSAVEFQPSTTSPSERPGM